MILVCMILFILPACDSASVVPKTQQEKEKPHLVIRQYSPISFYIAHREFVNMNPTLKEGAEFEEKAMAYIENRLLEMEPEKKGYTGMLKAFDNQQKESISAYKLRLTLSGLSKTESDDAPEPDFPGFVTTIEQELAFLKPAEAERNELLALEAVVKQKTNLGKTFSAEAYQGQIRELKKTLATTWLNDEETWEVFTTPLEEVMEIDGTADISYPDPDRERLFAVFAALRLASHFLVVTRTLLARKYAIDEQKRLYPNSGGGDEGDAFRHVYVNVLMRRWLGKNLARDIGTLYEIIRPNEPRHRAMDLHNNYVGYDSQYDALRGHWLLDVLDWPEMSRRTAAFIENSSNGHYIAAWSGAGISPTHPSTYADAYAIANTVSVNQYIYINP